MKKLFIFVFAVTLFFAMPKFVFAEQVDGFLSSISIQENSEIIVTENIVYDFGNLEKHGIYRDLKYQYQARGGNYNLDIKVLSVVDEDGDSDEMSYSISRQNGNFRIKIGDAEKTVTGKKNYVIKYKVDGAINYFQDHDELYFNVSGNDWVVDLEDISAEISLPNFTAIKNNLEVACYTGVIGSIDQSLCKINLDEKLEKISFLYTGDKLRVGEGLTVVLGFPKGIVSEPSLTDIIFKKIKDNVVVFLPILTLLFLLFYWKKHGLDPVGRGTIVPEFGPPAEVFPAEAGIVFDEKIDSRDTAGTIIDLARRGYIKIKQSEKKVLGFNAGSDWTIQKLKPIGEELEIFEHNLLSAFFGSGDEVKKEIILSKIKNDSNLVLKMKEFKNNLYNSVATKGWFASNPNKIRTKFSGIGIAILIGIYILSDFFNVIKIGGIIGIVSLIVSAILFILFAKIMPKKTVAGVLLKEKLEGFKMFLSVTEKDRVKFHFSPEQNPEKFAEYLPWAIIFGVEKEWAGVFENINLQEPDWYEGNLAGNFNALIFCNALGSFNNDFNKSLATAGASASHGASGFGGGGFSGGGFGGGGGGSW